MQNIDRRNIFYNNNFYSKYPEQNFENSQNYNNRFNSRNTNKNYYDENININTQKYLNLNNNQKINNSKINQNNNIPQNFIKSTSHPDSPNPSEYFSPYTQNNAKNNSLKFNPINLNVSQNNKNANSPLMNSRIKTNKKTLILDLDETLVHSGFHPFDRESDFTLNINIDGKNHTIYVLKRPYVDEFLSEISPYFEIIVFTASISEYASPLLDQLDKNNLASGRLFRQHCLFNHGLYLKDLKNIGKNLKDTIIIDNNPASYVLNQDNGLPILTWYDDPNDKELIDLIPLLKFLSTVEDVRPIIKKIVDHHKNVINFDLVEDFIKNKIKENNDYKKMIYDTNDNYNDSENSRNKYAKDYNYDENNDNYKFYYNNKNENKYNNYFDNENLYKYNNSIHDSLSNMTYNEIQNEGHINNNTNFNNNNREFNNYNNQKSNEYYKTNYNENNRNNNKINGLNSKEIQKRNKSLVENDNNQQYKYINNFNNNINNINVIRNENENTINNNYEENNKRNKNYSNRTYTPNINIQ